MSTETQGIGEDDRPKRAAMTDTTGQAGGGASEAEVEDLTLPICFDKVVRDRDEARAENDRWREEAADRLNDLGRLLRALGLSDHARPVSPAEVFDLCLREIEGLRQRIPDAEADALRLHREKMVWFDRVTVAEAEIARLRAAQSDPASTAARGAEVRREAPMGSDPVLTALIDIDRAVRSLYAASPALANCPDYVADMLREIAMEQASCSLRHEDLMRRLDVLRQRRALADRGAGGDTADTGDGTEGDGA